MSEQSDALNRLAREKGIVIDGIDARGVRLDAGADRPFVPLPRAGNQLLGFAESVGAIVGANGLFRRENVPVTIDPESGRVDAMSAPRFRSYAERHLVPYVERRGQFDTVRVPTTMSEAEARGCIHSDAFWQPLRKLFRVHDVRLPVMRRDGRIELLPRGYDPESQIYTLQTGPDYETDWSLDRALLYLDSLLGDFPFANSRARSAHLLAMVAVYGSALLPAQAKRLNFVYNANQPRAGKGLLVATALAGPWGSVSVQAIPGNPEEFRKILDSEALSGSATIFFDEVDRRLKNPNLTAFLTASKWRGRLMFSQQTFNVPQSAIVFLAGNAVELSSDLAGRFVLIDLWVDEADAQARTRKIKNVMDEAWLVEPAARRDSLSAMYAILAEWQRRGRPPATASYPGFEQFSERFGGMVECAGFAAPLVSSKEEIDPDYADMRAIVTYLARGVTLRAEFTFDQVVEAARSEGAFDLRIEGNTVRDRRDGRERFELAPKARSWFGKLLSARYGGILFTLPDGRGARFGRRGTNRQRRFTIEIAAGA